MQVPKFKVLIRVLRPGGVGDFHHRFRGRLAASAAQAGLRGRHRKAVGRHPAAERRSRQPPAARLADRRPALPGGALRRRPVAPAAGLSERETEAPAGELTRDENPHRSDRARRPGREKLIAPGSVEAV